MCKRWRELTRRPVLWKKVHVKLYGEKNCMVKGCQTEAARKFVSTLPSCVTYIWLDFMFVPGWAQPLYSQKFCAELRERFPQLEELFLKGATLTVTLPVFVELCSEFLQNVKKLTLRTVTFLGRHKESDFDGIHKIEALCLYACELKIYNDLEYLPMPLFKELDLTNTNVGDSWFSINPMFFQKLEVLRLGYLHIGSRAFHIIRNNTCYLKELYMCGTKLIDRDLNFDFPHLRTICLRCCASLTSAGIVSLIQSCQSLENVYVEEKMAKACEEHPYFLLNRCKLEIVKAYFCFDHYPKSFYD